MDIAPLGSCCLDLHRQNECTYRPSLTDRVRLTGTRKCRTVQVGFSKRSLKQKKMIFTHLLLRLALMPLTPPPPPQRQFDANRAEGGYGRLPLALSVVRFFMKSLRKSEKHILPENFTNCYVMLLIHFMKII